ncbi:MAG: PfkB family carbohydrate kinase, partial [Paracoccaceae bacterium]
MHDPVPGVSNRVSAAPAAGGHAAGGVARNVAEMLARLGVQAHLIGAVGNDPQGRAVLRETAAAGVNVDHVLVCDDFQTGGYTAVLDPRGELFIGLADTSATENLTPDMLAPKLEA